jgi:hypothetical protein
MIHQWINLGCYDSEAKGHDAEAVPGHRLAIATLQPVMLEDFQAVGNSDQKRR